jgi:hypothetical protein
MQTTIARRTTAKLSASRIAPRNGLGTMYDWPDRRELEASASNAAWHDNRRAMRPDWQQYGPQARFRRVYSS